MKSEKIKKIYKKLDKIYNIKTGNVANLNEIDFQRPKRFWEV